MSGHLTFEAICHDDDDDDDDDDSLYAQTGT